MESTPSRAKIVEGPIPFHALCEHHALPFYGVAHVGYIAGDQIIGSSKLTRLVRLYARRFTVQERLGEQIADTLTALVSPRGVAVHLDASHLCTRMRGVEEHSATVTTFWRGAFREAGAPAGLPRRGARSQAAGMTDVALVCGARGALGRAVIDAFLARGDRVVAVARKVDGGASGVRREALDLTQAEVVEAL